MPSSNSLPVLEALPKLRLALSSGRFAVLEAPPGAGKTTGIPPALCNEPWMGGQGILMLEPRRLAAIQAAARIAQSCEEEIGQTVGYRIRFESRVSRETRIEIVTEGILTRRMQSDPELKGVGLLIFDEFHERSLQADLGLAMALECAALRDDLRILVMSATLDGSRVSRLLDPAGAPVVRSTGRQFPVSVRHADECRLFAFAGISSSADYIQRRSDHSNQAGLSEVFYRALKAAVRLALDEQSGDILVFLPGGGEIRRAARHLDPLSDRILILPLYGELSRRDQDLAIRPDPNGRRRIILATNIAQTSLTIEGVGAVIDSGFARVSRYDPSTGMNGLELVRIARDAAEQRTGRAGRLGPGMCIRLWASGEALLERTPAEILEADLAPFLLDVLSWGSTPQQLRLLDTPPAAALQQARDLLEELGAIESVPDRPDGLRLTERGRQMANLPLHPRLARLMLAGQHRLEQASLLAALISERDIFRGNSIPSSDIELRLDLLQTVEHSGREEVDHSSVDREAARRVLRTAQALRRPLQGRAALESTRAEFAHTGALLAVAFPDRIARQRETGSNRYLLSRGRGAVLESGDPLQRNTFLVVPVLDGTGADARIRLCAALDEGDLRFIAGDRIRKERIIRFDSNGAFTLYEEERLDALTMHRKALPRKQADSGAIEQALLDRFLEDIQASGALTLPDGAESYRRRVEILRNVGESLPDLSAQTLLETARSWLLPFLAGLHRPSEITDGIVEEALRNRLSHEERQRVDALAPERISVPSGSSILIDYSREEPVLAVKLQEMFGLAETPAIAGGRTPLTLHLLSPAGRPVQVTKDLRNFWNTTYGEVRRELRGRYPKHPWPEDPWTAPATRKAKPRK